MQTNHPLVTFYGDDFTGSTDALSQFHRFGMRGILLFDLPSEEDLLRLAEGIRFLVNMVYRRQNVGFAR